MNTEQKQAYEWAINNDYQSVAARYAKTLAGLVDEMQAQLKLEHGEALAATENCLRLQGEVNDLQAQLAIARRRAEKAIADLKYIAVCETCKKSGVTEYPEIVVIQCEYYDSECGCGKYEWRGDAEDGENETTVAYFTLCKDNELGYVYKCASCGNEMYRYVPKYCSECGRRIVEGDAE
jgi:hypothetical protein